MEKSKNSWPGWETVHRIGSGSFGTVYEIQRDVFGEVEKSALKVISIPQNESDIDEMYGDGYDAESITSTFKSHLKSIVAEYSLMRKMNGCVNIVNCDDIRYVQHDDGFGWDIFIKMELLTPLMKTLPTEITEEMTIKVGKDICNALVACKEYGIVHRDIKPQNIFVSKYGDYKLGDFGIAKTVEKTMGGTKTGTYKYMAPEVYNNQPYGTAADIYSLGLVLYWMLNERRMPFLPLPPASLSVGMDEIARARRFSGERIPAPKNGSEELKAIVLKACAYDPKERFQSAQEMLQGLKAVYTEEETEVKLAPVVTSIPLKENVVDEELTVGPNWSSQTEEPAEDTMTVGTVWNKTPVENTEVTVAPAFYEKEITYVQIDSADISVHETTKQNKKKWWILVATLVVCVALTIIAFWPVYGDWSEWQMDMPKEDREIKTETATWYRFREKTTMIVENEEVADGVLLKQWEDWSEYSEWSEWQEEPIVANEMCEVESETLYRKRNIIMKEKYTDWSKWSKWSTNKATESETKEVETRKVYYYNVFKYRCKICGSVLGSVNINMVVHANKHACSEDAVTVLSKYIINKALPSGVSFNKMLANVNFQYKEDTLSSAEKKLSIDTSSSPYNLTIDGAKWFVSSSKPSKTKTQYRYRTRKLETTKTYTEWTNYTNEVLVADKKTEVETTERFRFRTRDQIVKREYEIWGEWTDWQPEEMQSSETVQVEQRAVYRFAKRYFLVEKLLNNIE